MNKHLHRIIFNKVRGLFMVVQETASSAGGSAKASAQTGSPEGPGPTSGSMTATLSGVRFAVVVSLGMVFAISPLAQAQIAADPNVAGNQRPIVLNTANGLPLVNIQTPSAAGVSRNVYNQFDISAGGAVLNNSRGNVQTQLGGFVQGNPFLATGSARVILNEVNSSKPSQLRGYVEVAGQRAEVIIANPAGINIDGGGFINASRVTLTTGTPILSGGSIDSYRVQRGSILISGAGLDTSTADYTGILARAVQANAGVWAKDLKVVTGANEVGAAQATVTPIAGLGAVPSFALDVAQLGGMYANHIFLIGTQAGVGVRNAGVIGATAGDVVLKTNGWLTNSGTLQGQTNTSLQATGLTNSGHVVAGQTLTVATAGALDNSAGTLTAPRLDITAASLVNRGGVIEQTGSQALLLQSQSLSNAAGGQIGALPASTAGAATTGNTGNTGTTGTTASSTTSTGTGTGNASTTSSSSSSPAISAPAGQVTLADGRLHFSGALNNDGGRISAAGGMDLASQNGLNNNAGTLSLRQLSVMGGDVSNQGGSLRTSAVRTGDAEAGLKKIFDAAKVQREINAQVQITQAFSKEAPKAVATFATSQIDDLKTQAKLEADPAKKQAFLDEADKWSEGGRYRVLLHTLAGAFSGGAGDAAGAAVSASSAPLINQLQDSMTNGLQAAGLGADGAKGIAQVIATLTAAGVGAAVGGAQGAATAATVDANNRQLHPTERQRATVLAAKGVYSKEKIEEQMRLMGNVAFGVGPNTPEKLTTQQAIANNITLDPGMPKVTDGKVVVEVMGQANAEIQQYIIANTKDGAGYIPGASPYSISNIALNSRTFTDYKPPAMTTAACGNMDLACRSGVGVQQNTPINQQTKDVIVDGASGLSRQAGVVGAAATAIGSQAGPYAKPFQALAVGATVVGVGADAVEQTFRPNNGQTLVNSIGAIISEQINKKLPIVAPVTNEVIEILKTSPAGQTIEKKLNALTSGDTK